MSYKDYQFRVTSELRQYLLDKGFPSQSIKEEYSIPNSRYAADMAIVDNDAILEIFEIKTEQTLNNPLYKTSTAASKLKKLSYYIPVSYVYFDASNKLIVRPIRNYISSFASYYRALKNWIKDSAEYIYFYRGHANIKYNLEPSIYRNLIDKEQTMFRDSVRSCPSEFPDSMKTFDKLVKMQHYGLPTRLLDITSNPLVALYFACCDEFKFDAEVLIFKIRKQNIKYYDSDTVAILSNIAKCPLSFGTNNFNDSKCELMHQVQHEKIHFKDLVKVDTVKSVVCVLPKLDNPRIQKQSGSFLLYGVNGDEKKMASLTTPPMRIMIKKEGKEKILEELSKLGIDQSTLFPDIDNILKHIRITAEKQ